MAKIDNQYVLRHHREKGVVELFRKEDGLKLGEASGGPQGGICVLGEDPSRLRQSVFMTFGHAKKRLEEGAREDLSDRMDPRDGSSVPTVEPHFTNEEADSRIVAPGRMN